MAERITVPGAISLDRFDGEQAAAQVIWPDGTFSLEASQQREPHRHDYHELFIVRAGTLRHHVDGVAVELGAGTAMLVGRGQVHSVEWARDVRGAFVRFSEQLLGSAASELSPGWLLAGSTSCVMHPPERELDHAEMVLRLLDDELHRPPDRYASTLVANALSSLLVLVRRWQESGGEHEGRTAPSADVELLQRFGRLLEAEYASHHDAAWYAGQLGVSANHLAAALTAVTGRSTKRLVTDRVMVEAERLLRFTDMPVQQVALRLGYDDPFHLSRAFKAHSGRSPMAWRAHARGTAEPVD
jgi:AraC family transcriptional activator of pobA